MSAQDRAGPESGFALVDLLVGIAVAGLSGSILVGLVTFLGHHRSEAERRIRAHDDAFAMERIVRTLIAGAPPFLPGAPPRSGIAGSEREVSITSTGLPILSLSHLAAFTLTREARGQIFDVVLRWRDEAGREHRDVVLRNAFNLSFAYRPQRGNNRAPGWQSQWRAEDGELSALRLTFRSSPSSAARIIEVPVQADFPAACLRNPRRPGCTANGG